MLNGLFMKRNKIHLLRIHWLPTFITIYFIFIAIFGNKTYFDPHSLMQYIKDMLIPLTQCKFWSEVFHYEYDDAEEIKDELISLTKTIRWSSFYNSKKFGIASTNICVTSLRAGRGRTIFVQEHPRDLDWLLVALLLLLYCMHKMGVRRV